jgi:hypothetical protein
MTSTFEVYKANDPVVGIDPTAPINPSYGFEYKTVPHITLKSIARNVGLDPIFERHDAILAQKLQAANEALAGVSDELRKALLAKLAAKFRTEGARAITDADLRRWLLPRTDKALLNFGTASQKKDCAASIPPEPQWREWEVPFDTDADWPQALQDAVKAFRDAWRAKMDEVNAAIAASAEQEELVDQPIVMLFSSPADRPRWSADAVGRRQLRGDVCAVAYRIGHRSPFDMPGERIQQVYGVYRTVIDPENTFNEGLRVIMDGTPTAPTSTFSSRNSTRAMRCPWAATAPARSAIRLPWRMRCTTPTCCGISGMNRNGGGREGRKGTPRTDALLFPGLPEEPWRC